MSVDVSFYPRYAESVLAEALEDSPAVLLHGPRQCGKTTLAQRVGEARGYSYFSFDEEGVRAAALTDPVGFVSDLPERTILDEVQLVPELFLALKLAIDRRRAPGRFVLTGSANVLLVPAIADSLAGRLEILRLHPLSQAELVSHRSTFLDALFAGSFATGLASRLSRELAERVVAGGYPAALARRTESRRAAWYRNYLDAVVQRDVRELARIRSFETLPRLLALAATLTGRLLNVSDLASPFQVSRPTIQDYLALFERVFLIDILPPWHSNLTSRLIKSPKLHLGDTGLACALLGLDAEALHADRTLLGQLLETFVFQELRRQASWRTDAIQFFHFRDKDMAEVDVVLERGARELVGVEVKAAATVTAADFRGLQRLKEAAGERFKAGVVLYDGEATLPFGDRLFALPLRVLWETGQAGE